MARRPHRDTLERIGRALGLDSPELDRFVDAWRCEQRGPRTIAAMFDGLDLGQSAPIELQLQRDQLRTVAVHERHSIGADRGMRRCEMSRVLEVLAPGLDRFFWLTDVDANMVAADRLVASRLHNCRAGSTHMLAGGGVKAFEFQFGRSLTVGERYAFGYSIDYDAARRADAGTPVAETEVLIGLWAPSVMLSLQVEFAPGADPVNLRRLAQPTLDGPEETAEPIGLSPFRIGSISLDHPGHGAYGIRWEWPDG